MSSYICLAKKTDHKKELQQVEQSIKKTQAKIKLSKHERSALQAQLKQSEIAIGNIQKKLYQLRKHIDKKNKALSLAEKQKAKMMKKLELQKKILAKQVRSTYQSGQTNGLKLLLNQENPEQLSRTLHYFRYFNEARLNLIEQFDQTVKALELAQDKIKIAKAELNLLHKAQVTQKTKLINRQKIRRNALSKLQRDIKTQKEKLADLKVNKKRLNALIDALNRKPPPLPKIAFSKLKGKLPWPTTGKITRLFGSSNGKQSLPYNGVLIRANSGQRIKAIATGKVVFADWLRGFGLLIIINHGQGYMTLFAHCQSLTQQVGHFVQAGTTIATVGSTGGNYPSGLYFQVRYQGKPQNPRHWCHGNP